MAGQVQVLWILEVQLLRGNAYKGLQEYHCYCWRYHRFCGTVETGTLAYLEYIDKER